MARLTQAPDLLALSSLGYEWRRVAHNPAHGEIMIWFGDLHMSSVRNRFQAMIREGKIICVTNRSEDGADTFAKISTYYNANKAHQDAIVAADRSRRLERLSPFKGKKR